jgi:signal transduction histidine kinase
VREFAQKFFGRLRVHIDDLNPVAVVTRSGQPLLTPVVDLEAARAVLSPELWLVFERAHPHSALITPLRMRDQILGTLALFRYDPEQPAFTADDLTLAQDLADRAALAIENVRLFGQLSAERALLAERVAERTVELRQANAELARATRLKDEFLANMSHELRTPLTAILGRTELLQEEIYGPLTTRQVESLDSIEASGRHLLSLINDILDLSKIEAGKIEIEPMPILVDALCRASLQMITQSARARRISLNTTYDSQVSIIYGDERRVKQILVNLLTNAVKFTPEGGAIGLEVQGNPQAHTVSFTVWDTGIGIAADQIGQLFQPFMQIDHGLNRQYEGTGLGLSLVQRLTEAHGGSVDVESAPGAGSRFCVTLPWPAEIRPASGALSAGEPSHPLAQAPLRSELREPSAGYLAAHILLAEDNEENSQVVVEYLCAHGFSVTVARNGFEALLWAEEARPAIILMDIQMPGMDGLETIRRIRANEQLAGVPIIALTALAMPGDRERCLAAGADDYLAKPVSLSRLREMIVEHLR